MKIKTKKKTKKEKLKSNDVRDPFAHTTLQAKAYYLELKNNNNKWMEYLVCLMANSWHKLKIVSEITENGN